MKSFVLIPFARDTAPQIKLTGEIERHQNQLNLEYRLEGLSEILVAEAADSPLRQFDLWEHTCFEFFVGLKESPQYWEFNLSPSGHWNVFRFLDYRQNITEEEAFAILPFQVFPQNDHWQLKLTVDLNQIIAPEQDLEIGITAVIEAQNQHLSYWALTHPAPEADFHCRDSFMLKI